MHIRALESPAGAFRRVLIAVLVTALALSGWAVIQSSRADAALDAGAEYTVVGGHVDWGVKLSFRNYITGPIAHGSIDVSGGATTNPDGTFRFPATSGSVQDDTVAASSDGTVDFKGHEFVPGDFSLELTLSDPRIQIQGDEGALIVDIVSKSLEGGELVDYPETHLLDLDLSGVTPTTVGDTTTWASVPSTITEEGFEAFAEFYPAGTDMDPVTIVLELEEVEPPVEWNPEITVSKSTDVDYDGETVTVTGTGFDPNANISTRPPVPAGMPTGVYVVFGKFADTWEPSEGAPATARRVIDQKWPLPAASKAAAEAAFGPNPQYVVLEADGSFELTLHLAPDETLPEDFSYGIVTYAAGGAVANAAQETFTPVSFTDPPEPEAIRIEGTVTDADGDPVEGVWVMAYEDGDTWVGSVWAHTDEFGDYVLEGAEPGVGYAVYFVPPAGSNLIRAWALPDGDGWTTTTERTPSDVVVVDETNRVEVIDVALVRGGIVEGRVTQDGVGVADVAVWLYRDTDSWVGFAAATTDEDGYFRLEGVIPVDSTIPATEFRVMFRPPVELGFGSHLWSGGPTRGTATLFSVGLDETIDVSIDLGGTAAQ